MNWIALQRRPIIEEGRGSMLRHMARSQRILEVGGGLRGEYATIPLLVEGSKVQKDHFRNSG